MFQRHWWWCASTAGTPATVYHAGMPPHHPTHELVAGAVVVEAQVVCNQLLKGRALYVAGGLSQFQLQGCVVGEHSVSDQTLLQGEQVQGQKGHSSAPAPVAAASCHSTRRLCLAAACLHIGPQQVVQRWVAAVIHEVKMRHPEAAVVVQPLGQVAVLACGASRWQGYAGCAGSKALQQHSACFCNSSRQLLAPSPDCCNNCRHYSRASKHSLFTARHTAR